ncbi:MAG TPA: NAD(P)-dependent oxidoreductase [Nitrospira sp.]|nr:NAD(P)-dependent oxidoreductase [Nitrospira sp.]
MTQQNAVAVIGTGILGRAVAERLCREGRSVLAYNRTASKARPLETLGVTVVSEPEQAIAQASVSLLFLSDAEAIRSVLFAPHCAEAVRGKTIIQMGTIGADESRALRDDIVRLGGDYFEAPVLGSMTEARAGTLLVMVGGTEAQFDAWGPIFRSLSRHPVHVGAVGKAAALKLALNQLIASETAAFALSLGLVRRADVSIELFMDILRKSALYAPTFDKKLPRFLARNYAHPNFTTKHLLKDLMLFLGEAKRARLDAGALEAVGGLLRRTIERGLDGGDYSSIYETIDPPEGDPNLTG